MPSRVRCWACYSPSLPWRFSAGEQAMSITPIIFVLIILLFGFDSIGKSRPDENTITAYNKSISLLLGSPARIASTEGGRCKRLARITRRSLACALAEPHSAGRIATHENKHLHATQLLPLATTGWRGDISDRKERRNNSTYDKDDLLSRSRNDG